MSDGIHRIAIPTPFAVGRVNVYLIEDDPLTLVDAGPNSATSFDELTSGLAALGHSLEDIELVILTHQHIDHLGLVSLVARYGAGAELTRLDGISIDYPDWHFNVRPSNTEPLLRLNLESLVSPEHMEEKRDEVLDLIRA